MSASEVMSIFMPEKSSSFVFFRMYGLVSEEAERMPSRVIWTPNQPPAAIPAAAARMPAPMQQADMIRIFLVVFFMVLTPFCHFPERYGYFSDAPFKQEDRSVYKEDPDPAGKEPEADVAQTVA